MNDAVVIYLLPVFTYFSSWPDAGPLLRALTQFSHHTADTIINGSATAHMAPVDLADRKTEIDYDTCKQQNIVLLQFYPVFVEICLLFYVCCVTQVNCVTQDLTDWLI